MGEAPAQNADAALLDALVREHRDAAVAYATRVLGDAHLAEDAVQRAFLQILVRVRGGDEQLLAVNPRAVVLRGTRWAALKLAERHSSRDEAERRAAGEALVAEDDHDWDRLEARMLIEDILPSLPEHYRDVLRLRYLEGRPDATAAEDLAVTLKAYRRRLDRALVVARVAALRIGVTSLSAGLLAALRRLRTRVTRFVLASHQSAWSPISTGSSPGRSSLGHIVLAVAVVGLIVGTPLGARHATAPAPPRTGGSVAPVAGGPATGMAGAALGGSSTLSLARALPRATATTRPAGPPSTAANETADDVQITDIVPAPRAAENHTAVASGYGRRCACDVLLQTEDGGATWAAYSSPGLQVMLPPAYPQDPRIFLRSDRQTLGFTACVEARISDGTCRAYPTVVFTTMAFDPAFDAGNPVIYVSSAAGVLAYNVDTGATRLVEANDGTNLAGVTMVAAGAPGRYSVYLLMRGTPVPRGQTVTTQPPTEAAPVVGATHVVGCTRDITCRVVADVPSGVYSLVADRDDATGTTLMAFDGERLYVVDAARGTYQTLVLASSYAVWTFQAVGDGAAFEATVTGTTWDLAHGVIETWRAGRGWSTAALDPETGPGSGVPVLGAMGGGRVFLASGPSGRTGLWCTRDWGAHWAHLCPAA